MKKVLSLFLAVMMVASIIAMMPVFTVSAADPSYDGDSFDPRDIIRYKKLATIDTNSISTANGSDSASKLFDGDHKDTKWEFGSSAGDDYQIAFKTTEVVTVANYVLFTGGDTETYSDRNPRSFTLWGSTDGVTYTEIDIVTTTGLDGVNSTPYGYAVDTPKAYQYYKLTFKADGGYFQLNELQLYTADDGRDTDLNSLTYNRYNIPCSASANVGCGFIDGNIRPIDKKIYPTVSDIFGTNDKNTILNNTKVYVDGVEANLNNGYLGYTHNSIHDGYAFGIIGTSLTAGQSTDITFLIGDDYYMSFTLDGNNIGVNAHQVISSETTYYNDNAEFGSDRNSLVAKVTFADSVPVQVGEEVDFRLHDEHDTERTATVSAIEGNTITFVATNFTTKHSLCEFTFADETKFSITIDNMPATKSAIGFVQLRPNSADPMGKFDVRIIVETFKDYIKPFDSANITATVEYGNNGHREFEFDTTTVYQSIKAGNETLYPSAGCLYFGGVITGIPNGDYNVKATLTLTVDGNNTEIVLSQKGVDVSNPLDNPAKNTQEATKVDGLNIYCLEESNHAYCEQSKGQTVVVFDRAQTLSDFVGNKQDNNDNVTVIVNVNGINYKITKFANDGPYFRPNIQDANVPILEGLEYDFTVYVFDANYKMVYYTNTVTHRATYTTKNTTDNRTKLNVELPGALTNVTVKSGSISANGLSHWGDGAATNLFDGNTTGTKIGGKCSTGSTITVNFSTETAQTITYYTLYTGGDTASNADRNPLSWKLSGKVGNDWVVLSDIGLTNDTVTGLEAKNSTPYSYKVKNPQSCTEYKIEFVTASDEFQMNELVLHTGN